MKKKDIILTIIGSFLISVSLIRLIFLFNYGLLFQFFWLCNHAPLIMGLAILFRSSFWLIGEFSLSFIGMIVWSLDYGRYLLSGSSFSGSLEFSFPGSYLIFSVIAHLLVPILALISIFIIGRRESRSWQGSVAHAVILLFPSIYLGAEENLNCIFESCLSIIPTFKFYSQAFVLVYFLIFVTPINALVNKMLKK